MEPRYERWQSRSVIAGLMIIMTSVAWHLSLVGAGQASVDGGEDLQIEVAKKRVGKHVVISQGAKDRFMLIDVTPENVVIHSQEKYRDRYIVDESETHDRPMTSGEVESQSQTTSTA